MKKIQMSVIELLSEGIDLDACYHNRRPALFEAPRMESVTVVSAFIEFKSNTRAHDLNRKSHPLRTAAYQCNKDYWTSIE